MKRALLHLSGLAVASLPWAGSSVQEADAPAGFEPNQHVPDLELPTLDGSQSLRLSDLRGRRLLLIQFASW
jgi:hypothetical protein